MSVTLPVSSNTGPLVPGATVFVAHQWFNLQTGVTISSPKSFYYTDIQKALQFIASQSPQASQPWTLKVLAGTYNSSTSLVLPANTFIIGVGKDSTFINADIVLNPSLVASSYGLYEFTHGGALIWDSALTSVSGSIAAAAAVEAETSILAEGIEKEICCDKAPADETTIKATTVTASSVLPKLDVYRVKFLPINPQTNIVNKWKLKNAIVDRTQLQTQTVVSDSISSTVLSTTTDTQFGITEQLIFTECDITPTSISEDGGVLNAVPWVINVTDLITGAEQAMASSSVSLDLVFNECYFAPVDGTTFSGSSTLTAGTPTTSTVVTSTTQKSTTITQTPYSGAFTTVKINGGSFGCDEMQNGGLVAGLFALGNNSVLIMKNTPIAQWSRSSIVPHIYVGEGGAWADLHDMVYKTNNAIYASTNSGGIDRCVTVAKIRNTTGDLILNSALSKSFVDQVAQFHSLPTSSYNMWIEEFIADSLNRNTATTKIWLNPTNSDIRPEYYNIQNTDTYILNVCQM
jgi:hypothetical protein